MTNAFLLKTKTEMKSNCKYPHVIKMPSVNNFLQHRSVTTIKVFILLTGSVAEPRADNCCIWTKEQFTFLWQHPRLAGTLSWIGSVQGYFVQTMG